MRTVPPRLSRSSACAGRALVPDKARLCRMRDGRQQGAIDSGTATADLPEAEQGESGGEDQVDARLDALQWPEAARGLVADLLSQAEAVQPVDAVLRRAVARASGVGRAGEHLARSRDRVVRQDPCTRPAEVPDD